ncbi:MAG: hypothetical protein M3Y42_12045 [Actinomycetota bacterium]|nr:hypothetical protein [Actinomycetota bacterium]
MTVERESAVTPSASPGPARSPEPRRTTLLRRALLLGLASGGLWIAGSLGHGATAQAATPHPAPLAPVTSTLHQVVSGLLGQPAHSAASPVTPVAKPISKPAPRLPAPIVNAVVQQAHSTVTTLVTQTLPGTVGQLVSTVDSVVGVPATGGTPVASTPPPPLPLPSLPVSLPGLPQVPGQPLQGPVAGATPNGNALSTQAYSGPAWLLTGVDQSADANAEAAALTSSGGTSASDRPAIANTVHRATHRPAPTSPTNPSPACPSGAPGSSSNGGQPAMSLVLPAAAATSSKLRLLATPAQRAFAPRERASAPAVSPD